VKVNKLRIRGFRNITDTTLDTGGAKFIVVRGANRNGKTTLAEGLSLALTPTTWGLSAKGDGYARKIKRGENKAILEVELQTAIKAIRRTVTLNVNSAGRTQSSEDANDPTWNAIKFEKLLEDKKAALGIAINTRAFQSMIYSGDEKAQKNLLAQLVLPVRYDFPRDIIADVEDVLGQGINFEGEPFAVIEQAYKKLFNERQDVNRKVKEFLIPDPLPRPQGVNSESLKSQLSTLRDMRTMQAGDRDVASKKANEAALKRERANAKIETLEAILKFSKDTLRALQENILPNPNAVQEIASRKAEYERLLREQQRLLREEDAVLTERDNLLKLSNIGSTCPTCDQEIDEAKLVQLVQAADAKRTQLTMEHDKTIHALEMLGDVNESIAKLERHKKALAERDEVAGKMDDNEKALKEAKDDANEEVGGLFEAAAFDNPIAETDRNIETILRQIQPVIAAEEKDKEIATKKDQLKRLELKAEKLDVLVKVFDKDGIKAKLIAEYIGGFERKINEVLRAWDYSCALSIEPFKFEVTDHRGVSTPLLDLSGAEELMFYAAFQCAVSRTAGIGFVVIDRVDTLLPDLRPALYRHLFQAVTDGTLDQVILLVADTSEQVPKLNDSRFFIIEEGNIRRL
jgi:DNA repair exonuclease SbcCD ATPase subunit